jgi:cobalt/nickel transport system permease protein
MHVPDGFLSPHVTLPAYAVAAPLWTWAVRRRFGGSSAESLPLLGSLSALALVLQTLAVPVPGGTSTHLVGMALLAIVHGPLVAFVCESLVLAVQALFLGVGGVTALAVNALALGLAGPGVAWLVFRALRRLGERPAAFVAAYAAMQASSVAVALVLGLQHAVSERHFPLPFAPTLAALLLPSLTVAGVLEGAYTLLALALLRKARVHGLA